jgi:hypothetical protein
MHSHISQKIRFELKDIHEVVVSIDESQREYILNFILNHDHKDDLYIVSFFA